MSVTASSLAGPIHIVDRPGDEPTFVLMHGFPDDHHIYDHLAPLLSPRRVVAFDFFGYGLSGRAATAGTRPTPSEDLTVVIDSLELEDVVLVGHDASGPVAINYGLEHPEGSDSWSSSTPITVVRRRAGYQRWSVCSPTMS